MAKLGSDRNRDKELDSEIDMEEMDNLSLEDPWGGESSTADSGGRKPANPSRRILVEGVKGMAEGAMSTVGTELERNMPNLGVVTSELKGTYEDIQEVKDEISRQLQPLTLSMEKTARKILPRAEKLLPKSWYDKIKSTLDRREEERRGLSGASRSVEAERADLISSELASVFQQQLEMNQHNELEDKKKELMDRAVSATQHRDDQHAYARIYDAVRSLEISHRTHMLAYMKKSLELKYKHLFVAQDTFNLLSRTASVYEGYLQGIVKNTSLPDVMKTNMSDYIRKSRTDKYGTMMADFMSNARKTFFNRVKQSIKDLGSNLQMVLAGPEQMLEGIDMANEMGEMTGDKGAGTAMAARMGGGILGSILSAGPIRRALEKAAPYTRTIDGKLENAKTRAYMQLDKTRAKWSQSGNFFKELIADFLPSINTGVTGSNDLLTKGEDAAAFDKLTRQSIVEIIPGYLGKIWHELTMLRTGDENIKERAFNIHRRDFTTVEQIQEDILSDERMFGGTGVQSQAVSKALATVRRGTARKSPDENVENILKDKEEIVSKIIANHVVFRLHFDPELLSKFSVAPQSEQFRNSVYLEKLSRGINYKDFVITVRAIVRGLTNKDGSLNSDLVRNFENAILSAFNQSDSYLKNTPFWTEAAGQRRFIQSQDEVRDSLGNIIQKARKGLIKQNNQLDNDTILERVSRIDRQDARDSLSGYDASLKQFLSDSDYVSTRLKEMKSDFKNSSFGKFMYEMGKAIGSGFADKALGNTPATGGATASSDFMGPLPFDQLPKKQQVDYLLRKGDYLGAIRVGGKAAASQVATVATGAAKAADNVSEVIAKTAGGKGKISTWATGAWEWADKQLDKLPQTPEEVEACCENLNGEIAKLWKKTPKSRKAAVRRLKLLQRKLKKRFPKQAAFIDAKVKQIEEYEKAIAESRIGKAVSSTATVAKKKLDPHIDKVTKAVSHAYDAVKSGAKEVEEKLEKKVAESTGIPADVLAKALRGDKDAISVIKEKYPEIWSQFKQDHLSKEALEKKAADVQKSIGDAVTEAIKKVGQASAAAANAYKEGAGIKDKVPGTDTTATAEAPKQKVDIVNEELMQLLQEWRGAMSTEHASIADLISKIGQTLETGITVNGIGGGAGGTIERKRYGLFGKAGDFTWRGISGLSKTLWRGAKKVGGLYTTIYGSLWKGASNVAGSLFRGATNVARWTTAELGVTPYLDLYVKGQEGKAPILTWRKQAFGKGVYFLNDDGSMGDRVKTTKEIIKSGKQVVDPDTGNILVTYEDHKNGLWCRASALSTIGRMGMLGIKAYGNIYGATIKAVGGIGKVVAEGLFGKSEEKFVDVYLKGHINDGPLVTRRQQMKGQVVFKDGSKVERSSDIHEPVYDITKDPPAILITEEQIKEKEALIARLKTELELT